MLWVSVLICFLSSAFGLQQDVPKLLEQYLQFCYGRPNEPNSLYKEAVSMFKSSYPTLLSSIQTSKTLPSPMIKYQLPILLVCGHPGPCNDMLWLLKSLSIPLAQIDIYGYYMARSMSSEAFRNNSPGPANLSLPLHIGEFPPVRITQEIWSTNPDIRRTYQDLSSRYGTVLCLFPGNQCGGFFSTAQNLILHFSHRWHHHLSDSLSHEFKSTLLARLQQQQSESQTQTGKAPWITVVANNPFDVHHIYQYLGVLSLCLPSLYGNMLNYTYHPLKKSMDVLLLPHHGNGNFANTGGANSFSLLVDKLTWHLQGRPYKIDFAKGFLHRRFEYDEIGTWTLGLVLPYATHTSAINEAYTIGLPLLLPHKELLAALHFEMKLMTHVYINSKLAPSVKITNHLHCDIDHHADRACLAEWLGYADFYRFPHTTLLAHRQDLPDVLDKLFSNESRRMSASQNVRMWVKRMLRVTSALLGLVL